MRRKRFIINFCPVCDRKIWKVIDEIIGGKLFRKLVLNEFGMHFWIKSNNCSVMKIAVCKDCFKTLNKRIVDIIVEDIKYTWNWEIKESDLSEDKKEKEFNRIKDYKAVSFAETEEEVKK